MQGENDSSMASQPSLSTLPPHLIRFFGNNLKSSRDLVMFSATCKHVHSAIGVTELAMQDVKGLVARWKRNNIEWIQPLLIDAIETGKDIDYIKQCMRVYNKSYRGFIQGIWNRLDRDLDSYSNTPIPKPMAHAAKFGRLDVIQALLEFGDKMDIRERDTIAAACNAGHEDVMCFLISNGLGTTSHRKVYILEHFARTHYSKALALLLQDPHFSTEYGEGNKVEALEMYLFSNESNYEMVFLLLDAIHTKSTLEKTELVRRSLVRLLSGRLWGACATRNPAAASSKTLFILKVLEKLSSSSIEASGIIRQAARHNCFLDAIKLVLLSGHPWTLGHSEEERSKAMQGALDISLYCKSEKITQFLRDQGCKYSSINLCRAIRYKDLDLIKKVIDSGISVNCTFDFKDDELPVKLRDEEYDDDYDSDDYYYSDDYYSVDYYSDEDDIDSEDDIVCRINGIEETDETIEERARIIVEKRLHVLRTPLQEALYKFPYFLPAFKLLYLGADYTNVSEEAKDWLYKCLWRISFLSLIKQRDNNKSTKEPTRLSFAGVSCKLDENFPRKVEMLDAMARLVLGNEYIQKLQEYEEVWDKKYKVRFRSWEP